MVVRPVIRRTVAVLGMAVASLTAVAPPAMAAGGEHCVYVNDEQIICVDIRS